MKAERRALESKHEYDHVSKLVKAEMARFEQERIEDFKDSLHAFLEGMISRQKEVRDVEFYPHPYFLSGIVIHLSVFFSFFFCSDS